MKNSHIVDTFWGTENTYAFTGNGARAGSSRRADEVRGFSETGYSYFGARYYDSDLSGLFLSIDPMADKYPFISPYAYCAWNPLKLVDPDGMEMWKPEITSKGEVSYVAEKGDSKESFVRQYNVSQEAAVKIFENAGIKNVSEGTRISGETVASSITNKTGRKYNDVLKINWNNVTDDQKVYHTMFSILCNNIRNGGTINLNGFINGLAEETGANSCLEIKRHVKIPLPDGKTMQLQFFDATFSRKFAELSPQPMKQFTNSDGSGAFNHTFVQPTEKGSAIPRLLIAAPQKYYDSYAKSYY